MPEFVLEAFQSTVTMTTLGALDSSAVPELDADAEAVLHVDLDHMKSVFKYQTDSADVLDVDASDLKYYVNTTSWPTTLNPANAKMDVGAFGSGFADNKKFVAHDFTRYLADELFGTHQGVDLFNNEVALLQNLRLICGSGAAGRTWYDIVATLNAVSTTAVALANADESGDKYTTNADDSIENICRVLHRQIASVAPERFTPITDSASPQSLPFAVDDIISFKLIINPAANQHLLTGLAAPIAARSYKIKLVMKTAANIANTAVDAAEA